MYERMPIPARLLWECDNMTTEQLRQLTALISTMKGDDCEDQDNSSAELESHTGYAPFNVET
eukprot:2822755-Prymnesium_polylepis.1